MYINFAEQMGSRSEISLHVRSYATVYQSLGDGVILGGEGSAERTPLEHGVYHRRGIKNSQNVDDSGVPFRGWGGVVYVAQDESHTPYPQMGFRSTVTEDFQPGR